MSGNQEGGDQGDEGADIEVSSFEKAKRDLLERIEKAIQDAGTPKLEYEAPDYPPVFLLRRQ